jgi:hypothetical protein
MKAAVFGKEPWFVVDQSMGKSHSESGSGGGSENESILTSSSASI